MHNKTCVCILYIYVGLELHVMIWLFKGLRLTAGRRPSNDFWLMVWEDWAEILRANPGRAMLRTEAGIMRSACLYGSSLGLCWAQVVPMLGPCLAYVGPMLAYVSPMLPHVQPSWDLCRGLVSTIRLQDAFFPFPPPPSSPKPRKNRGFSTLPTWNPFPPKGSKHRKKLCFWSPQTQNTVNYVGFSRKLIRLRNPTQGQLKQRGVSWRLVQQHKGVLRGRRWGEGALYDWVVEGGQFQHLAKSTS